MDKFDDAKDYSIRTGFLSADTKSAPLTQRTSTLLRLKNGDVTFGPIRHTIVHYI